MNQHDSEESAGDDRVPLAEDSVVDDEPQASAEELEKVRAERDEYLDAARRVQAEFENYRRRVQRDQTEAANRSVLALVENLLPVLDSFELAVTSADAMVDVERILHGVGLVYAELLGALERAGLARIASDGVAFDPNEHEAVLEVDGDNTTSEPIVAETMRHGYRFQNRIVRPAMVKVIRSQ
ncbi:MAG: nucleotide exchange factor GrpE [Acidimicrobiia bacterium]